MTKKRDRQTYRGGTHRKAHFTIPLRVIVIIPEHLPGDSSPTHTGIDKAGLEWS